MPYNPIIPKIIPAQSFILTASFITSCITDFIAIIFHQAIWVRHHFLTVTLYSRQIVSSNRSRVLHRHFLLRLYRYDTDHDKIVQHKKLRYQYQAVKISRYYYNIVIPASPSSTVNSRECHRACIV